MSTPQSTLALVVAVTQHDIPDWRLDRVFDGQVVPLLNWLQEIGVPRIWLGADLPENPANPLVPGPHDHVFSPRGTGVRDAVNKLIETAKEDDFDCDTLLVIWHGHGMIHVDGQEGYSRRLILPDGLDADAGMAQDFYNIAAGALQARLGKADVFKQQTFLFDTCATPALDYQNLPNSLDLGTGSFHAGQTTIWAAPLGDVAHMDGETGRSYFLSAVMGLYGAENAAGEKLWFPELVIAESQWEALIMGLETAPVYQAALNTPGMVRLFQSEVAGGKALLGNAKTRIQTRWRAFCEMMLYKEFLSELYSQCLQPMQAAVATVTAKNTEEERREYLNSIQRGKRILLNIGVARNNVKKLLANYRRHLPADSANNPISEARDAYQTILELVSSRLSALAQSGAEEPTFEWLGGFASLYYEVVEAMESLEESIHRLQKGQPIQEIAIALGTVVRSQGSGASVENAARLRALGEYLMRMHQWLDDLLARRRLWQQARTVSFGFRVVPMPPARSYRAVIHSLYRKIPMLELPPPEKEDPGTGILFRAGDYFVEMDFYCSGLDTKNLTSCAEFFEYVNDMLCACTDYCDIPPLQQPGGG